MTTRVAEHLSGKYKPIWDRETDCGDHVVVINTQHVAMHSFDWKQHMFLFNRVSHKINFILIFLGISKKQEPSFSLSNS